MDVTIYIYIYTFVFSLKSEYGGTFSLGGGGGGEEGKKGKERNGGTLSGSVKHT